MVRQLKCLYVVCDRSILQEVGEPVDDRPFKDWVLVKETELRLEVGSENTIDIRV